MPIYEYVCQTCGGEFEVMQKFSDPDPKSHDCSPKSKVQRKLSLTSFHLTGGGWYSQGYAKNGGKNGKNGKSAEASGKTESSAATPAKSEAGAPAHGCGGACACT